MNTHRSLPQATVLETAGFLAEVFIPVLAQGPLIRRPKAVAAAERLQLDRRAVRRLQKLHDRHPQGPLMLRIPFRHQAVILAPDHVHRVLDQSPEPFATASSEKRAALAHYQPRNVLISHGAQRQARRTLQEQALDSHSPVHQLATHFIAVLREEANQLLQQAEQKGVLDWDDFTRCWHKILRRIIFGDNARDDHELTDMLARLRSDANWSFLKPQRKELRARFLARVQTRLHSAEQGSLASIMATMDQPADAAPADQVPQWLFAFDSAGMAAFRALAVLTAHTQDLQQVQNEIRNDGTGLQHLPYLRACMMEALRLWPTTPMILRQTTRAVDWDEGTMPANCGVLIFAPYFHRDERHLSYAHSFEPERWLDPARDEEWPLIPFSDGPAFCPGKHLSLMLTSAMLACLLDQKEFQLASHELSPHKPLPGTLNHFSLRFNVHARST